MSPFQILFFLFLLIPVVEIYLLIKIGGLIGAIPTVFLVVFTAVLGAGLLRLQGFATLRRVQAMLARGEVPAIELFEGVVLLVSGALLLTPGFFTDVLGFLGLIPAVRRWLIIRVLRKHFNPPPGGGGARQTPEGRPGERVIEGEYERKE